MSDVDIVLGVAVAGVEKVYNLSNALQQLNRTIEGSLNPMRNLDARSRALSAAIGSSDSSLKNHAKSLSEVARNNAILTNEMMRVRKEISGLGTSYKFASIETTRFKDSVKDYSAATRIAVRDLKAYEQSLKSIRVRALVEDLKSLSQEQKRLGKDAQFVGRSLIIGLTTPIMGFSRLGLQSLVAIDKEFVRLNKVLESVAPNLESAAKKMSVDLGSASKEQNKQLQTMVDRYNQLDKALTNTSTKFGLAKSLTVGLAGDFAELGIQTTENIALITELTAKTEKLGNMDIGAAKDLVQSLYFQALRAMQQSGESVGMPFQERERKAIQAATAQLNLFNSVENVTALTLRDLGDAFPEVAAAATSFGLSMTEAAALLAPMKAAGFETGASANSIKVSLQRLTAPTKQNAEMFKELSKQYNVNFNAIKGTGLDAIQQLVDGFNTLKDSAAGQEGAMEFFAKVFGVRQGPRMEVAIAQMAEFDKLLKNDLIPATTSAEKRLQGYANTAIRSANVTKNANLPVINSFRDIGIIARIATANAGQQVEGLAKRVTQEQINAAKQVREELSKEILKAQREGGEDLIGQVGTEAGRAMFIELAGGANAAQIAQRELDQSLASLDTQLSILRNNFKMFTSDLVKGLKPAIEKISELSTKLYNAWAGLDEQTKKLISTIALLAGGSAAAIGPLIFVFGQFRLAMGSIGKVLFSFLPGLKTMSIETLAAKSGMLNLTKALSMQGDTVVNTSGKFATFIATIASGNGPVGIMAKRLGEMTGVLQKTSTAPMPVMRALMAQKTDRGISGSIDPFLGAVGAAGPTKLTRTTEEVEEAIRKRLLRSIGFGSATKFGVGGSEKDLITALKKGVISDAGFAAPGGKLTFANIYRDITQQMLVSSGYATVRGGRGARGFAKAAPDLLDEAETLQAAGYTSTSTRMRGPKGRFVAMTKAQKDALKALEDAQDLAMKVMNDAKNASVDIVKNARTKADEAFQKTRDLAARGIDFDPLTGQAKYRDQLITGAQLADVESGDAFTRFDKLGRRKVDYDYATGAATYRGRVLSAKRAARVEKGGIFGAMSLGAELFDIGKERTSAFGKKGLEGTEKVAGKFLGGKQVTDAAKGIGAFAKDIVTKPGKAVGDLVDLFKGGFGKIVGFIKNPAKAVGDLVNLFKGGFGKIAGFIKNPMPMIIKLKGIIMGIGPAIISAVQSFGMFTGIGIVIAGVVAIVAILIKNWDQFVKAIQPGIETFKETFNILKDAVMGLVQPFLDFFGALSGDAEGSSAVVATIATAFNILADVIKVVSIGIKFLFVEIFGRLIRSVLASVIGALRGVGNFIMGIWNILKGIFTMNWGAIVDGFKKVGKGIAQIAIGLMGPFAGFFTFVLKGVKSIFDQLAKLPGWLGGGMFKKASQGIGAAIKFIDDTRSMEGKKGKGKLDAPDVDTDPLQEKIASASGDGMKQGADEGAKELAKRAKQALKDLKREVQEEIADRIKNAMESVVDQIQDALKAQKEASLKVYDDQIKKIEDVAKSEGRLTKEIEYQNRLREAEMERSLNRMNSKRSYAMAVYAGNVDEAVDIAAAASRQEVLDNEKIDDINKDRAKEVAEQNRADLIDSIKDAKQKASEYFDSMIKSFTDAAKKITEFPPTTAEEFNTMLNQLIEGGNGFIGAKTIANNMGTMFSQSFSGALSQLGVNASGPLTSSLEAIGKTLTDNNPFGENGIWNKTIDESIDALTRKYQGLTNTLTTIINTKSDAFKNLYTIYKKYQDLVNPADSTGGTGGGGGGSGSNGGYGKGFNNDGVKIGNKVAIASANADLKKIKDYSDKYLQEKYGNTAEGKRLIASIKGTVGSIASSAVLLGGHDEGMKDYYPIVAASKYKDQITTNSELIYAYIVNNRALFMKGAGALGRTDENGRSGFFKGGMLPYMMGGATKGPTQQGIPALLHGGEYVVRNSAVKKYGWGMMQQINQGTYKPKPFAVGGMIPKNKIKDEQYFDTSDPAYKEWSWQQSNGAFNYAMLRAIAKKESAKDKTTKGLPNWTDITGMRNSDDPTKPNDKLSGGFNMPLSLWRSLGGLQFGPTPGKSSVLSQMVINNRLHFFGYKTSNGMLIPPRLLFDHVYPRQQRGAADTDYINLPEYFDPEKSYQENLIQDIVGKSKKTILAKFQKENPNVLKKDFAGGFATPEGKRIYLEYLKQYMKHEKGTWPFMIRMPFSTIPEWYKAIQGKAVENGFIKQQYVTQVRSPQSLANGGLVRGYENGGMPLPVPTPEKPSLGNPPPPYKTWAEYFAKNGQAKKPDLLGFTIDWSKEKEKEFNKYIKKGYVDQESGLFISPFSDSQSEFGTLYEYPGFRWGPENVLGGKPSKYVVTPLSGAEAMWKGGKGAGKDWNVWNAKAEHERLLGKGFLSPFKAIGFNLLSAATDLKHSFRRTFLLENLKTMMNTNAPAAARYMAGFEDLANLAPIVKGGVDKFGKPLIQKTLTKNQIRELNRTYSLYYLDYVRKVSSANPRSLGNSRSILAKAELEAHAAFSNDLVHNPDALMHGNLTGLKPQWRPITDQMHVERIYQLRETGIIDDQQLSLLLSGFPDITRRAPGQLMIIGPGGYLSQATLGAATYAQGGSKLAPIVQPGFRPKLIDLVANYPERYRFNQDVYLDTASRHAFFGKYVKPKVRIAALKNMAEKRFVQERILASSIDINTPLNKIIKEIPVTFRQNPGLWTKQKAKSLLGRESLFDFEDVLQKKGTRGDGNVDSILGEQARARRIISSIMEFYSENPNSTLLDLLNSTEKRIPTKIKNIYKHHEGPDAPDFIETFSDPTGLSDWIRKDIISSIRVPLKFTTKKAAETTKINFVAPNNNPLLGDAQRFLTQFGKEKINRPTFRFEDLNVQDFISQDAYDQAMKLIDDSKIVRYGRKQDAYIFDPLKAYAVRGNTVRGTALKIKSGKNFFEGLKDAIPADFRGKKILWGKMRLPRRVNNVTSKNLFDYPGGRVMTDDTRVFQYMLSDFESPLRSIKPHALTLDDIGNFGQFTQWHIDKIESQIKRLLNRKNLSALGGTRAEQEAVRDAAIASARNRIRELRVAEDAFLYMDTIPKQKDIIRIFDDIFEHVGKNGWNPRPYGYKNDAGRYTTIANPDMSFENTLRKLNMLKELPYLTKSEAYMQFGEMFKYGSIEHVGGVFTNSPFRHTAHMLFDPSILPEPRVLRPTEMLMDNLRIVENARNFIHDAQKAAYDAQLAKIKQQMAIVKQTAQNSGKRAGLMQYMFPNSQGVDRQTTSRAFGGFVPGFGSQGVPAMLHGGEYVVNSSAVRNLGISALQAINNMRFNTPKSPSYSGPVQPQTSSTSTVHIYVDNFIGEKQWFESMMKDYNINVAPQNQKAAGLNNTTISTYRGINRGL